MQIFLKNYLQSEFELPLFRYEGKQKLFASHSLLVLIIESFFGLCATSNAVLAYFCNFKIRSNELCSFDNALKGFPFYLRVIRVAKLSEVNALRNEIPSNLQR